MTSRRLQSSLDWGHVALLLILAGITLFYLHDAWTASSRVRNLILVFPAAVLTLILCVIVLFGVLRAGPPASPAADAAPQPFIDRFRPGILIGLFGAYVLSLPTLGFDVGSALFMTASLLVDGERRVLLLATVPVVFAVAATWLFARLLPYPLPTLLL